MIMETTNGTSMPSETMRFKILQDPTKLGPRLGEARVLGRSSIATPAYVASGSRGIVPHVTPDLLQRHTSVLAVYSGLEDFLERSRQNAPILNTPQEVAPSGSVIRDYTCLPDRCVSIMGARRVPRVSTPHQSSNDALAISTSFGYASLDLEDHNRAVWKLRPDVSITAVDLIQEDKIGRKRLEKSVDRTHAWLRDTVNEVDEQGLDVPLFVSIPPLESEQQSFYLSDLVNEFKHHISGVCIYEPTTAAVIPEGLETLPVLCLSNPAGPHELLTAISLGVDLITIPFMTAMSEAGIALTFSFVPSAGAEDEPLGIDMWSAPNATEVIPLAPGCSCYACSRHHRAYLHHLLQAKEMLAWTLLQIHNFHIIDEFFKLIRASIAKGTFEEDCKTFRASYNVEMPHKTGQGPRVRGYQVRSLGPGEPKKNSKAYNKLEEQARKIEEAESGIAEPGPEEDVEMLESQGLGHKVE